jgi:glycosyltransferase involved in cell wall biosynthesis/peptidoglycan/xylan/chitin deacetylase (PgdA/CDA1 family)
MPPETDSEPAVLAYHRIGGHGPPGMVSATPRAFERQMRWLARTGRATSLADVLAARRGELALPQKPVLVTFDDAYADFAERAWPVLRRHGIPVTLFVPTAFPGDPERAFWWDRLHAAIAAGGAPIATPIGCVRLDSALARRGAYRALRDEVKGRPHDEAMALVDELVARLGAPPPTTRVLSWPELRALAAEGVTLAPHTRTHPRLDRLEPERLAEEVAGSRDELAAETGAAAPAFAYPGGAVCSAAEQAVRAAGFELAFTIGDRAAGSEAVPRLAVGRRTPTPRLRAALRRPAPAAPPAVAYVMSRFPKLSETFVLGEIVALQRRGVRVEVYPLLRARGRVAHPDAAALSAGAHHLPFLSPAILASQGHWLRVRPRAYLGALRDVVAGTWRCPNFLLGGLACFPKVAHAARLMQAGGVVHVHCHFANHPALAGFVIARLTGLPYSFTAHGSDLHRRRAMLPTKVAEAAFVATVSHANRRLILRECGERFAGKVHVVRAGVDTSVFVPNGPRRGGPLRIVCVGTLHEVKGQAHLIDACRLLHLHGVDLTCRLVGDGPDRRRLARRIAEAGLDGRVVLAGARTSPEVADELAAADVLVAPSVPTRDGRREGLPVAIVEALSSGVAVVASDLSGIPELVEHGVTGLLTAPGNVMALAAALRTLHDDPALRRRLGAAGRRRVLAEFDRTRGVDELARRFGVAA